MPFDGPSPSLETARLLALWSAACRERLIYRGNPSERNRRILESALDRFGDAFLRAAQGEVR